MTSPGALRRVPRDWKFPPRRSSRNSAPVDRAIGSIPRSLHLSMPLVPHRRLVRQRERERGAGSGRGFGLYPSAVALHDALAEGQADADALVIRSMAPLEDLEQLGRMV